MNIFWKEYPEMPSYEVNILGDVRNKRIGRILKGKIDKDGYLEYNLKYKGKSIWRRGHRIVAISFIPNPENKPVVNHKNGIKDDNRLENLEWATVSENTQHGFDVIGRIGHNGGTNKRILLTDLDGTKVEVFESMREASEYIGVSISAVSSYFKRKEKLRDKATIKKKYRAEFL